MQSLSALHVEHAHLLEEHGADHPAQHQREAELADVQAREMDAVQLPMPFSVPLALQGTARRGPSALLPSLSGKSGF
jgi:hypothetical protein